MADPQSQILSGGGKAWEALQHFIHAVLNAGGSDASVENFLKDLEIQQKVGRVVVGGIWKEYAQTIVRSGYSNLPPLSLEHLVRQRDITVPEGWIEWFFRRNEIEENPIRYRLLHYPYGQNPKGIGESAKQEGGFAANALDLLLFLMGASFKSWGRCSIIAAGSSTISEAHERPYPQFLWDGKHASLGITDPISIHQSFGKSPHQFFLIRLDPKERS